MMENSTVITNNRAHSVGLRLFFQKNRSDIVAQTEDNL